MQHYERKKYFGKSYASTCQHCGTVIYKKNRNGNGKHAWLAYSKAAYKQDANYEVLCRECYDEAIRKYGSMISREEILKRIDMRIRHTEKWKSFTRNLRKKQLGTYSVEGDDGRGEQANTQIHKSFKPYPIYTQENVKFLLNAYRRYQVENRDKIRNTIRTTKIDEASLQLFLTFITGFTVGAGMTKRPVMLDAAHKYIEKFCEVYKVQSSVENVEKSDRADKTDKTVDKSVNLDSIVSFFDSMAAMGMVRESVAKKARNICSSLTESVTKSAEEKHNGHYDHYDHDVESIDIDNIDGFGEAMQ